MSKSLEALCYLDDIAHGRKMDLDPHELKLIIEKDLKALEIIRNKHISKYAIDTLEQDWNLIEVKGKDITQEEYNLLKEVLL